MNSRQGKAKPACAGSFFQYWSLNKLNSSGFGLAYFEKKPGYNNPRFLTGHEAARRRLA
jgi:hypothetical protein